MSRAAHRRWDDTVGRAWYDCTSQWRDKHSGDLSQTKVLATFFGIMDFYSVMASTAHGITANQLWLALASMACAFGKSTFNFLLTRVSLQTSVEEKRSVSEEVKTVHYTVDGVPALSLPPDPSARTPGGNP